MKTFVYLYNTHVCTVVYFTKIFLRNRIFLLNYVACSLWLDDYPRKKYSPPGLFSRIEVFSIMQLFSFIILLYWIIPYTELFYFLKYFSYMGVLTFSQLMTWLVKVFLSVTIIVLNWIFLRGLFPHLNRIISADYLAEAPNWLWICGKLFYQMAAWP
jgi:hypothetical protein